MSTSRTVPTVLAVMGWVLLTAVPHTAGELPANWCTTGAMEAAGACTQGVCDDPAERDQWMPSGWRAIFTIHLKFNVFAEDDGSNPAATQAAVDAQVQQLNESFLPYGIQFTYQTQFIPNGRFRHFCSPSSPSFYCVCPQTCQTCDSEELAMKNQYADNPSQQFNVYVVGGGGVLGPK